MVKLFGVLIVSMLLVWKSLMVMVVFWKVVLFGLLIVMLGLGIVGVVEGGIVGGGGEGD